MKKTFINHIISVILLLSLFITSLIYFLEIKPNRMLEEHLNPYFPNSNLNVLSTQYIVINPLDIRLSENLKHEIPKYSGSKAILLNKLEMGQEIKLYRFTFNQVYLYNGVDLGEKSNIGWILMTHLYIGNAYIDIEENKLVRLTLEFKSK
ncbi:hypothetical protein [Chengkuizengella axinellae]|uniref:Uncharacterized protein n=1 Tax=Chengkuizengella axinellae TaxID=3064388 RepID=A0ABT9IV29_9BACL|nr:hypothetical protein [Chengkuizengella sp. 2205SS18-9]MDP5272912.1 hypothetical protein [Chengkuizengella sp. 2205SS18-9]